MGLEKRLHMSGEIKPGNLPSILIKTYETEVINMWIHEENVVWIQCSPQGIRCAGKSVLLE